MKLILLMLLGSCWASFCCTMTWRYLLNHKHQVNLPWSQCDHCNKRLAWWQLIPIVGYLIQRGRCHYCGSKIDYWWPLCELATALVWALASLRSTQTIGITVCVSTACLIISTQDHFDHRFQPIWLIAWLPILLSPHGPRNLIIDLLQITVIACGYFCSKIGNGDLDAMIVMTVVLGSLSSTVIILAACLLTLTYPPLYHHQPIAFMPFLSMTFLLFIALPAFSCFLC